MSSTMVTFCGGEPTERETVKETLWRKESLSAAAETVKDEGFLKWEEMWGKDWVLSGKMSVWLVGKEWV